RDYIVRNGATEGEIIIETDNDIKINRKIRTNQADYKSVKKNGAEVGSPETFLKDIFTPLQLSPVEFLTMDKKKQNAIILDMIEYDWSLEDIKKWFGEIPDWVSYDQNILQVLNDIQSENGYYFQHRQDVNRDVRNKKAFIEEIGGSLPAGYEAEKWEKAELSEIYKKIETIRKNNETIEKAKQVIENRDNKIRKFEADREIALAALDKEFSGRSTQIDTDIAYFKSKIEALEVEKSGLADKKVDKVTVVEEQYKAAVAKYDAEVESYKEFSDKEFEDFTELQQEAEMTEKMKSHINEYRRMVMLQDEMDILKAEAETLTNKIELARTLPGTILETATIPIKGLTVADGIPLINGLPVSNLSEGEKLDLCIDVAIQKPNGLQIILIDGVEKLASDMRKSLYAKCKDKGLQFIATRTTDEDDLTVIEL
ncbi:MAG: hypothetical protein PHR06_14095, partial [Candidatus Cloacimonetes bacterium]|nr:hypothetical protein [Candidatus Cloacimonadota bacterium]